MTGSTSDSKLQHTKPFTSTFNKQPYISAYGGSSPFLEANPLFTVSTEKRLAKTDTDKHQIKIALEIKSALTYF